MKNYTSNVWLQKNPNVISNVNQKTIDIVGKKIKNKSNKGAKCPKCDK